MKRGFTLLELLIVVAVMASLMGLVFKLNGLGADSWRRAETVSRLQKIENCLSGYHAAFGNYPPVKMHGSRDYRRSVNVHGIQNDNTNDNLWNWSRIGEWNETRAWQQVEAACRAQPVDCRFPYAPGWQNRVQRVSEEMKRRAESGDDRWAAYFSSEAVKKRLSAGFDDGVTDNINRHASKRDLEDWREIQLFKFGLMSFLLPRYLVMMNGDKVFFNQYAQWTGNNRRPTDPYTGKTFTSWTGVKQLVDSSNMRDLARLGNIPTQAVCARWIPNLAGICHANHSFTLFGTELNDTSELGGSELDPDNVGIQIFSPGDSDSDSTANQYILDGITVRDGWGREFFYYSPSPYQRYTLWSSGPNGRTFPPWVDREGDSMSAKARECISKWVVDDIIHLKTN
ncbi:MAG: type II secretion system GspH family protein [Kiritimatiellae bacterium]|nr:type II secretion system GspH family protein [Kiritimatiellia bacterium]